MAELWHSLCLDEPHLDIDFRLFREDSFCEEQLDLVDPYYHDLQRIKCSDERARKKLEFL